MTSYDIYRYLFIFGAIAAIVMLVISIIIFVVLNIKNVIGDLSGANAKKEIANIRKRNEITGKKTHKSSIVNLDRGSITTKIENQKYMAQQKSVIDVAKKRTQKLKNNATTVLKNNDDITIILNNNPMSNATTVLNPSNQELFEIESDITLLSSTETII